MGPYHWMQERAVARLVHEGVERARRSRASLASRVLSYLRAEWTHATRGTAPADVARARAQCCMSCEHRAGELRGRRDRIGWCRRCGCSGPRGALSVKVTLAGAECPLGAWTRSAGTGATPRAAWQAASGIVRTALHHLLRGRG